MKTCSKCGETKELTDFQKDSSKSDGYYSSCKTCKNTQNIELRKIHGHKYVETHKLARKRWADAHPENQKIRTANWRKKNPDYRNPNQKDSTRKFNKNHPDRIAANCILRRRTEKQAKPKWLSKEQIREIADIYKSARTMSVFHEEPYHVDHIEPIKGVNEEGVHVSCGLHVPWNLQILPAEVNLKKSNNLNY